MPGHLPPNPANCTRCGKRRGNWGIRDWCGGCTTRWYRAGCPETGPPPPVSHTERTARSAATHKAARDKRLAEYALLRSRRFPLAVAARRTGVGITTARAYERMLAQMNQPRTQLEGTDAA